MQYEAEAPVVTGEERDRLYSQHAERYPGFAEYQAKTTRTIPVVALRRVRWARGGRRAVWRHLGVG